MGASAGCVQMAGKSAYGWESRTINVMSSGQEMPESSLAAPERTSLYPSTSESR